MSAIKVSKEKCIACGACIDNCPFAAIEINDGVAVIGSKCTLCGTCIGECSAGAIEIIAKNACDEKAEEKVNAEGLWVFCEQFEGSIRPVALELLAKGRELAYELGQKLTAVLIGNRLGNLSQELIYYGADEVLLVEGEKWQILDELNYARALETLIKKYSPAIFLLGATSFGRSLAPRIAASLGTGLTADCTILEIDQEKGLLMQTRPAFGGNLMATIITPNHYPQMATVRPKVFTALKADTCRVGQVISENIEINEGLKIKFLELLRNKKDSINIGEADILIAVGRGIGTPKNIAYAEELANLLGGAVAVSRPLVDLAWYDYSHQVGQTGKVVAPKMYIACGISGAVQHLAGIAAETTVAVNIDPEAPIFNYAHYAIKGDCVDFLINMIELLKKHKHQYT